MDNSPAEVLTMDNEDSLPSTVIVDESSNTSFDHKSQGSSEGSESTKDKPTNTSRKSTGSVQNMGRVDKPLQQQTSSNSSSSFNSKPKIVTVEDLKFMQNFDPEARKQQKKKKRFHPSNGQLIQFADDHELCDCLRPNCGGCHLPCPSCADRRCGGECRVNRKWLYESVEVEGTALEFRNPHYSSFT